MILVFNIKVEYYLFIINGLTTKFMTKYLINKSARIATCCEFIFEFAIFEEQPDVGSPSQLFLSNLRISEQVPFS